MTTRSSAPAPLHRITPTLCVWERGWLSSNTVLCRGEAAAVIDTGHARDANQGLHLITAELAGTPLADVAHTHLHSDHCGGSAALLRRFPDARCWVPAASLEHARAWDQDALTFGATGQRCARFTPTDALPPGASVTLGGLDWQIHAAPGHDALAVLLFEPRQRVLIAGDAMWEHGVGVIFPHLEGSDGFEPFVDTLALIERLRPAVVVPGHGAPFRHADGAIDAALERARRRIEHFRAHPAQHALYAAKVLIKYQLMDVERMRRPDFDRWLDGAALMHRLHQQHRPELPWARWVDAVMAPMLDKGALRQQDGWLLNGD